MLYDQNQDWERLDTLGLAKNVLVVEDDPFWQRVIRRNIERSANGCQMTFVTNADDAIRLLRDRRFNLIIADQFLDGEKTGYDLWQECQLHRVRVPFLLTSGSEEFSDANVGHALFRFVAKPFVASEIRRTLVDMLGKSPVEALWNASDELSLEKSFLFAIAALLALMVYSLATPSFLDVPISLPWGVLAPPPSLAPYKSVHRRLTGRDIGPTGLTFDKRGG